MDKEKKNLSRVILAFSGLLLAFSFLLSNSYSYSDSDLGWHIRVGRDIISTRTALSENYYNYTLTGKWMDHEWFLNAGMAALESFGGFDTLHVIFALVALAALVIAFRQGRKEGGVVAAVLISFLALWASRPHLGIRVQEFGLLFSVFLIYTLSRCRPKLNVFLMPALFAFWANIHGSFLLGLALLAAYCAHLWIMPILTPLIARIGLAPSISSLRERWLISLSWLLSVLATLINPYGYRLYGLLAGYADTTYMGYIREWLGQYALPLYYPQLIYLAFVAALFIAHLSSSRRVEKRSLWEYAIFLLFYILAWRSRRHFPLFAFITLPLVCSFMKGVMAGPPSMNEAWKMRARILALITSFVLSVFLLFRIPYGQDQVYASCEIKYPCRALEELRVGGYEGKRVLNEFNWGGFLLYSAPDLDIFIDGRMPQERYGEWTILEEYRSLRYGLSDIGTSLEKHGIDTILIYSKDQEYRYRKLEKLILGLKDEDLKASDPLRNYLDASPDWRRVYVDNLASIYEKTSD